MAEIFCSNLLDETKTETEQQVIIYSNLGYIHYAKGDISTSLKHYYKAYCLAEEACRWSRNQEQARLLLVKVCDRLANIYMKQNDYIAARKYYWVSFKTEIDHKPTNYETLKQRYSNIASAYSKVGTFDKALTFYTNAIRHISALPQEDISVFMGDIYFQIANVYEHLRNKSMAQKYAWLAFERAIKALPAEHMNIITYKKNKEIAERSNHLGEIKPVMVKPNLISVYDVDDLINLEKNDNSLFDPISLLFA